MDFKVIISDDFANLTKDDDVKFKDNKKVLSFLNDYEDGKWRSVKFHNFIWDNLAETALTFKEREALYDSSQSKLMQAAKSLRLSNGENDIGKGSEIAEIMLYAVMKHYYKALPVVPKIYYKQNRQDNAKGADSVHIVIAENDYTLWFGEAKFFNKFDDSCFYQIVDSLSNALQTDKMKKENSIILGVNELKDFGLDDFLVEMIKKDLSPRSSIDDIKNKINIPIMIIHECNVTKENNILSDEYVERVRNQYIERISSYYKKHYKKLNAIFLYEKIKFHLIIFPVPDKSRVIDRFIRDILYYQNEDY